MKIFTALFLLINSIAALADAHCEQSYNCMTYNGQVIDLRSEGRRQLDNAGVVVADGSMPILEKADYTRLVGKKGTQYFIPINITGGDELLLAGALSLGVVVFANDREIMDFVQESKAPNSASVAHMGNMLGREAIAPIAAGAYFLGAIRKDGKLKKVGLFIVAGGIASQIVAESFKKSFQRVRPNGSDSPYDFFEEGNNSFISGHASGAFSMATVIAEVYKDKPLIPYLAYGAAAITAYARMHDNKHWASDVLAGAIASHLVTKILIRSVENRSSTQGGLIVVPEVGQGYAGLRLEWTNQRPSELDCGKLGLAGRDLVRVCIDEVFQKSE